MKLGDDTGQTTPITPTLENNHAGENPRTSQAIKAQRLAVQAQAQTTNTRSRRGNQARTHTRRCPSHLRILRKAHEWAGLVLIESILNFTEITLY